MEKMLLGAMLVTELPAARWLIVGGLALLALYLLMTMARCIVRLVGLAVLVAAAWLAWRWFA